MTFRFWFWPLKIIFIVFVFMSLHFITNSGCLILFLAPRPQNSLPTEGLENLANVSKQGEEKQLSLELAEDSFQQHQIPENSNSMMASHMLSNFLI